MSQRLTNAGHAASQNAVILLFQNLSLVTRLALSGKNGAALTYVRSAEFAEIYQNALRAYLDLCHEDAILIKEQDENSSTDGSVHLTAEQPTQLEFAAPPAKTRQQIIAQYLIAVWCASVVFLLILHFYLISRTARVLSRHTCKIPATLEIAFETFHGHVNTLGRKGNRFEVDEEDELPRLADIDTGMYCAITIADKTFAAKTIGTANPCIGMLFSEPLEIPEVKALLDHSVTKPKKDRIGRSSTTGTRYRFGQGQIPTDPAS